MRIKELRHAKNLSQAEIAKELGVSQKSISNYEKGITAPDIETLIKLADYFHTTIDNLCGHSVPYFLDTSALSTQQQNLIKEIKTLTDKQCQRLFDYMLGMKVAEEEKENIRKRFRFYDYDGDDN